jgi:hypothetical protein
VSWTRDDIEVLIDMLDDDSRRWFAAWELAWLLRTGGGITPHHAGRLAEIVDAPTLGGGVAIRMKDVEDRLTLIWSEECPVELDDAVELETVSEPRQLWQVGRYLFVSREEAQAYLDLRAWKKRAKAKA